MVVREMAGPCYSNCLHIVAAADDFDYVCRLCQVAAVPTHTWLRDCTRAGSLSLTHQNSLSTAVSAMAARLCLGMQRSRTFSSLAFHTTLQCLVT